MYIRDCPLATRVLKDPDAANRESLDETEMVDGKDFWMFIMYQHMHK